MKRFNLFLAVTMIAFGSFMTSCTTDLLNTTVTITLDNNTFTLGTDVTGTIDATGGLQTVSLMKDGAAVSGWPVSAFGTNSPIAGSLGEYSIKISNLAAGNYSLTATDKNSVSETKTFTVEAEQVALNVISSETTIYCTLADGSDNSTCASADGTTYAAKTATVSQQTKIDFVFFNGNGTEAYGPTGSIYSPSSIPSGLSNTFSSWTTKNTTYFYKNPAGISYSSASYTSDVLVAANAATNTNVTNLMAGDVVVFKTTAGKIGLFKVNSITGGYLVSDYVKINIKVEP